MTGRAGTGAATFGCYRQSCVAQDLHDTPVVTALEHVLFPVAVRREDFHATPSFFCRLEEDVVYWKRSFSFGRQIWNAACAISAASWKPHRISFSLPG